MLTEKVISEEKSEGDMTSLQVSGGKAFQIEGTATANALRSEILKSSYY